MITESIDLTRDNIWFWFTVTPNNQRILREFTRKVSGEARCPNFDVYVRVGWCAEMGDYYGINTLPYDGWNQENEVTWEEFCKLFNKEVTIKASHSPFFVRIWSEDDLRRLLQIIKLLGYPLSELDRVRKRFQTTKSLCVRVGRCRGFDNDIWWTNVDDYYYCGFKELTEVFIKGDD